MFIIGKLPAGLMTSNLCTKPSTGKAQVIALAG
jgi:hypothetical protein